MSDVVLVDSEDRELGSAEKIAAHLAPGLLHRALSAFVFTTDGRLLLQRRADVKYHFAGLWSNTCCTHPTPGEDVASAGERRLTEELGMRCRLSVGGSFIYRAADEESGLVEHELDHVLVGVSDDHPRPAPSEVSEVRFVALPALRRDLERNASAYTPWLGLALDLAHLPTGSSATRPPGRPTPPPHEDQL